MQANRSLLLFAVLLACGPGVVESAEGDASSKDTDDAGTSTPDVGASEDADTGGLNPVDCETTDPSVDASFEVDFGLWSPADPESYAYSADCTIESVTETDVVVTELLCTTRTSAEETPTDHTVRIEHARSEDGPVAWVSGDNASLHYEYSFSAWTGLRRALNLSADNHSSMLVAFEGGPLESGDGGAFELWADKLACENGPYELVITRGQSRAGVVGGHRGLLQSERARWAIDIAAAHEGECCSQPDQFSLLIRELS